MSTCGRCGGKVVASDICESCERALDEQETVWMRCLCCGKPHRFALDSPEAGGIFNVFCDGECEDRYAARL